MRIVRFLYRDEPRFGLWHDEHVELLQGDPFSGITPSGIAISIGKVQLLAPVAPSKVIAVGLNYRDHAAELKMDVPTEPILFLKPPSSVIGLGDTIIYPEMTQQVDYEGELAVVIGRRVRNVSIQSAGDFILGYTCGNDVTARDLQQRDDQWTRAKGFDTFCPLGPWIETEVTPGRLQIKLTVNGEVRQRSSTRQMIFGVPQLVSFISRIMTLNPGDVILTGTPPGVGSLAIGDTVKVDIQGIGILENKVN